MAIYVGVNRAQSADSPLYVRRTYWARRHADYLGSSGANGGSPAGETLKIQLAREGIAKIGFFYHQNRVIVFWLFEFWREDLGYNRTTMH